MKTFTIEEMCKLLDIDHWPIVNRWLERGDGIAVYENVALDSANAGHKQFLSYGSPAAQFETPEPPQRLLDIGSAINWKYQLVGTYKGAPLTGPNRMAEGIREAVDQDLKKYVDEFVQKGGAS
jgi:hypothetical protein